MKQQVYLLLGSNRGDREQNLLRACAGIEERIGHIAIVSAVYETQPWGFEDSTSFYNQALMAETELQPAEVLQRIHETEAELGRVRDFSSCGSSCECSQAYASRTIDIDILFYGSRILFTDELMIPHPRLHERLFTLVTLHEIAPGFIHPVYRKTVAGLLSQCTDKGEVSKIRGK